MLLAIRSGSKQDVLGSAAYALYARNFRWEGFASLADLRNQLVGAVLMGFGGVTALGCTIGQGLSGVSTLAIGSFIVSVRRTHLDSSAMPVKDRVHATSTWTRCQATKQSSGAGMAKRSRRG